VNFLFHKEAARRNGGIAFELQKACPAFPGTALGRTALHMIQSYLAVVKMGPDAAHQIGVASGGLEVVGRFVPQ
jgi:hypothetical protein